MAAPVSTPILTFRDPVTDLPLAGGFVHTYEALTTTDQVTYADLIEATPNDNPIELDSAGQAIVYLSSGLEYTFVVKRADLTTVYTVDGVFAADPLYIQGLVDTAILGVSIPGASTTVEGIIEIATDAEVAAGTATDLAVVPSSLAYALGQLFDLDSANGEATLFGLEVKWGKVTTSDPGTTAGSSGGTGSSVNSTVTFHTPFTTSCDAGYANGGDDNATSGQESAEHSYNITSKSSTQMVVRAYRLTGTNTGAEQYTFYWFALGH